MEKLILSIVSGGLAGYVTNDIAISMLFKKYLGRFGGVIVDTRDSFEKNVSKLIESEIINHDTLSPSLKKEEVREQIKLIVNDFLKENLFKNVSDLQIEDLKHSNQSFSNIKNKFNNEYSQNINEVVNLILSSISFNDVFDTKNCKDLSSNIFNILTNSLKDNSILETLIDDLNLEHKDKNINEIISKYPISTIENGTKNIISKLPEKLTNNYKKNLDNTFQFIYDQINIEKVLGNFSNKLMQKTLIDILGEEKSILILDLLKKEFLNFLKTSDGKQTIEVIAREVFNVLKNEKHSLKDLLSDAISSKTEDFFKNELPLIMEDLIKWLRSIKNDFEKGIETSVNNAIESKNIVKRNVLKIIRNVFFEDIAKKYELVEKIINYLDSNKDNTQMSRDLSEKALNYLKITSIGDIIKILEEKNIFTPQKLIKTLSFNLNEISNSIPNEKLLPIFDIHLESLIPDKLKIDKLLNDKIKEYAQKFLENYIFESKLEKDLNKITKEGFQNLRDLKLSKIDIDSSEISKFFITSINNNKTILTDKMSSELKKAFSSKNFSDLIPDKEKKNISTNLHNELKEALDDQLDSFESIHLKDLIKKINSIKNIDEKTTNNFLKTIDTNLEKILKGNIENIVSKNINQLSNDELNKMMKDFMGNELKAINLAGAGLGALVGAGTTFLPGQDSLSLISTGENIALYSLIGVITNYLAIKMIFKPYKKIVGIQGVIPKNQPKFAKNMANFIDERLLNKDFAIELFETHLDDITVNIKNQVSKNDFDLIIEILKSNKFEIFNVCFEYLKINLEKNKEELSNKLINQIEEIDLSDLNLNSLFEKINVLKSKLVNELEDSLLSFVKEKIDENPQLDSMFPKEIKDRIFSLLNEKIEEILDSKLISKYDAQILKKEIWKTFKAQNNLLDSNIETFITDKQNLKKNIQIYIKNLSKKTELKSDLSDLFEVHFSKEINPEKKIKSLFDGKLIEILNSNINALSKNILDEVTIGLNNQKQEISDEAISQIKEAMGVNKGGVKGLFKKAAYGLTNVTLNVEGLVEDIVNDFVYYQTPDILKKGKSKVEIILEKIIRDFGNSKVKDFSIGLDKSAILKFIENTLENKNIIHHLEVVSDNVLDGVLSKNLKSYLKKVDINGFQDILNIFEIEILEILDEVKNNLESKLPEISENLSSFIKFLITKEFLTKDLKYFTDNLTDQELQSIVKKVYSLIFKSQSFENNLEKFIDLLKTESSNLEIKEIINLELLKEKINMIFLNDNIYSTIKEKIFKDEKLINNLLQDLIISIDEETKENIIDIILNSFIPSFVKKLPDLLDAINISKITEEEVNSMSPQKLEKVFNTIAGKYFQKLIIYGLFGFIFGINNILGSGIGVLYLGKKAFNKSKKEL